MSTQKFDFEKNFKSIVTFKMYQDVAPKVSEIEATGLFLPWSVKSYPTRNYAKWNFVTEDRKVEFLMK